MKIKNKSAVIDVLCDLQIEIAKNCGDGAGGFKPGNQCQGGGHADTSKAAQASSRANNVSQSALNRVRAGAHGDFKKHIDVAQLSSLKANKAAKKYSEGKDNQSAKEAYLAHASAAKAHTEIAGLLKGANREHTLYGDGKKDAIKMHIRAADLHSDASHIWKGIAK